MVEHFTDNEVVEGSIPSTPIILFFGCLFVAGEYPCLCYEGNRRILPHMNEEAYCVKCRAKRQMKDAKEVSFKGKGGDRRAMTGLCEVCGTKMFKILGKKK